MILSHRSAPQTFVEDGGNDFLDFVDSMWMRRGSYILESKVDKISTLTLFSVLGK